MILKVIALTLSLHGVWSPPGRPPEATQKAVQADLGVPRYTPTWKGKRPSTASHSHSPTPSYSGHQGSLYQPQGKHWAKPGRWCGWYMRKKMGVHDPKYNLARNWAKWGSPSGPQIGAVVVWRHHVGVIVGQNSKGQWLIQSGNDGGKVRTRVWNLSKVIAYRI